MIKFVIVDDDKEMGQRIKKLIRKISCSSDQNIEINMYSSITVDLKKDINDTSIQTAFILDIELPGKKSGIDIAQEIRKVSWESLIIFVTNHDKMFESVYRNIYNIFDFIEKFHNFDERLENDIRQILDKKLDEKRFVYSNRNLDLQIFLKSITYVSRDKEERKIIINTDNNQYVISMSLADCLELLDDRFKYSHRSCIVNTKRVQSYNWSKGYFVLDSGDKVEYLSKKYKKDLVGEGK